MLDTPFSISPDPNALFLTPAIRSALHRTKYTIEHRQGLAALLGDVGLGKSTMLRYLHGHYSAREDTVSRLVPNPQWPSKYAMAKAICQEFGLIEPKRSLVAQQATFERFLTEQIATGRNVVLFLDEAQVLAADQLEVIRTMLNFETDKEKLIQIVMAGQLDLRDRLLMPKHKALFSRIFAPTLLNPLLYDEMVGMLKARCDLAEIALPFREDALRQIHDYAGGIPREILKTCELSYSMMRELGADTIDANLVIAVCQEGRLVEQTEAPTAAA
jgi:general secretion pathway protein A